MVLLTRVLHLPPDGRPKKRGGGWGLANDFQLQNKQ